MRRTALFTIFLFACPGPGEKGVDETGRADDGSCDEGDDPNDGCVEMWSTPHKGDRWREFPYGYYEADASRYTSCAPLDGDGASGHAADQADAVYLNAALGLAAKWGLMYASTDPAAPGTECENADACADYLINKACDAVVEHLDCDPRVGATTANCPSTIPLPAPPTGDCPQGPLGIALDFSCTDNPGTVLNAAQRQIAGLSLLSSLSGPPPYDQGIWTVAEVTDATQNNLLWYAMAYGLYTFATSDTLYFSNSCGTHALGIHYLRLAITPSSAEANFKAWLADPQTVQLTEPVAITVVGIRFMENGKNYVMSNGSFTGTNGAPTWTAQGGSSCAPWWDLAANSPAVAPFGIIDPLDEAAVANWAKAGQDVADAVNAGSLRFIIAGE